MLYWEKRVIRIAKSISPTFEVYKRQIISDNNEKSENLSNPFFFRVIDSQKKED